MSKDSWPWPNWPRRASITPATLPAGPSCFETLTGSRFAPPGHPAYPSLRLLEVRSLGQEYAAQKQYLDFVHQKAGLDVFVSNVLAAKTESTGEIATHCVWSQGVEALLPHTDKIGLMVPGAEGQPHRIIECTWETAQAVVGDLMVPVDIYPPRVRVKEFPSPSQLETIVQRSGPDVVETAATDH